MKLDYDFNAKAIERDTQDIYLSMEIAATAAARKAGARLQQLARSNIASTGFGSNWTQNLKVNVYPISGESLRPTIWMYHRIRYAGVFETGETIYGLMIVPTRNVPERNGRPMRAREYRISVGGLIPIRTRRGRLLLVAEQPSGQNLPFRSRVMYVGVTSVNVPKKFNLEAITEQVAADFDNLYFSNLVV